MRRYRSLSAALVAVVFCALLGGFFGRSALVAQDQIPEQYKVFTAALSAVEDGYVGKVESDRLVYGAITGIDYSNPLVRHVAFTRRSDDVGSR